MDERGNIVKHGDIKANISKILEDPRERNYDSIGYFTFLDRNKWANIRRELEQDNGDILHFIDSAV